MIKSFDEYIQDLEDKKWSAFEYVMFGYFLGATTLFLINMLFLLVRFISLTSA